MERDEAYIRHILDAITAIEKYTKDIPKEQFLDKRNQMMQDAVIRELEVIGEAVKRLSDTVKEKSADVPWRDIGDMRNILIHEYFGVDLEIVWETLQSDIPHLRKILSRVER
ncbi:MAG: hypothetical protein A3D67_04495 [Candidatus Lloydbacteria bacterium RIFCSPHIGHO2_02_FULL_51_22]|uniref:DUF86 domain-containing protein n=3 Tax=Candidatus Lloydiibacteriota TaxID=1817910 RepID=A0A1G2D7V7_9BACT|nr:MAG: hypothetical protein A3D67_04495 [Candidatus Lloydbacteria bacterium RIFCSPHIGHO2_02_FULL_51_22]OGZ15638.1 MAG: hypothetical protein A3J08_00385 [Candidatus Lloydbacteria bacterium RIFCSPLOWO2_02_FULL_51_11]OGZ15971.1 MAG: hypothetical protein A3G11_01275 [Candidatus Lloydbacteria bacterium RIFCSPLOWO2_12_FULL_51_9]